MTFERVVNMKTAKMLGITFPSAIMVRATRVIQGRTRTVRLGQSR